MTTTPARVPRQSPKRGRPRSEQARESILHAAAELLLKRGLDAVSMDAVAEHAGVSKATIYRWWPTKETLALDALYTEWAERSPATQDTGSLRGDLLYGALYHRLLHGHAPLSDRFVADVVDMTLHGVAASADPR